MKWRVGDYITGGHTSMLSGRPQVLAIRPGISGVELLVRFHDGGTNWYPPGAFGSGARPDISDLERAVREALDGVEAGG